ncbi:hypothetical protein DFH11DRAFT_435238 [Phellopilus nigrolimitatus]|nr:hypothetical protein DFH11DRAFT_435238 [Phellopilus nigrolimitatus]
MPERRRRTLLFTSRGRARASADVIVMISIRRLEFQHYSLALSCQCIFLSSINSHPPRSGLASFMETELDRQVDSPAALCPRYYESGAKQAQKEDASAVCNAAFRKGGKNEAYVTHAGAPGPGGLPRHLSMPCLTAEGQTRRDLFVVGCASSLRASQGFAVPGRGHGY